MVIYLVGFVIAFLLNYKIFRKTENDIVAMSIFFGIFSWVYVIFVVLGNIFEHVGIFIRKLNVLPKLKKFLDTILLIKKED